VRAAFALGFALGAAPGPVQVLILSETAKRGLTGGLRVMLGANGTLWVSMLVLALGFYSLSPDPGVIRVLKVAGGAFLLWLAITELRPLSTREPLDAAVAPRDRSDRAIGPTSKGVIAVVLNPGAWLFIATTASAVVASATAAGGRVRGIAVATSLTIGTSISDLLVTSLGSGGRAILGERAVRILRIALASLLLVFGVALIVSAF
jgi:threonine/homoserine/homoserine lactone efflux protein